MPFQNQYVQQRIDKATKLRELGHNPYRNDSERDTSIAKFININSDVDTMEDKRAESRSYTVAGRIKLYRLMGKASFLKIEDESGILQVYVARDNLEEGFYNEIKKLMEAGDIIEVTGYPFVTKQGELTLHVNKLKILTKAVAPLPEKYHGITDKEARYRQRYLDLIMNAEVKVLNEKFEQHLSLFEDYRIQEAEKFDKLLSAQQVNTDCISKLTTSLVTLVEDTSSIVQLHKDFQGAARVGKGVQDFMMWCMKWGAIGIGVATCIGWVVHRFNH